MNSSARLSTNADPSPVEPSSVLMPQPCPLPAVLRFILHPSSFILCSLALFFILSPNVSHALTEGDYTYTVTAGQATITRFNTSYSGALSITNTLGGYPVTAIGDTAFSDCSGLTSVTIPDSVTTIGNKAFMTCSNLTGIQLPKKMTGISDVAFGGCGALAAIVIPGCVTNIGDSAFNGCGKLVAVSIPASVTTIGKDAFLGCASLSAFTLDAANSAYTCEDGILFSKDKTTLVMYPDGRIGSCLIPGSVVSLGDWAFGSCKGLTSIQADASNPVYSSENGVLFNKERTTLVRYPRGRAGSYKIPDSVANIGHRAFSFCGCLSDITIPDSVKNIEASAFAGCAELAGITIPSSVTNIGQTAFVHCFKLTGVYFKGNAPACSTDVFNCGCGEKCDVIVYYKPDTKGWGSTFGGRPSIEWQQ